MNRLLFDDNLGWLRETKEFPAAREEIEEAENPAEMRKKKIAEYKEKFANPYVAASKGYIDAVIEPSETRHLLLHALELSANKVDSRPPKKHGIPPF